jgi:hypothetical protein
MKFPSTIRPFATHGCAFCVGLLALLALRPGAGSAEATAGHAGNQLPPPSGSTAQHATEGAPLRFPSRAPGSREISQSQLFRTSWAALAHEELSRPERLQVSREILRRWIREDWQEALNAVMKETPDDFELLEEFHDLFRTKPAAVWAIIERKPYGVLTHHLRSQWMLALATASEESLAELQAQLPTEGAGEVSRILAERRAEGAPR